MMWNMKPIFILLTILSLIVPPSPLFAGRDKAKSSGREGYLKKDRLSDDRINIHNMDGSKEGYLKQDRLFKDRMNKGRHHDIEALVRDRMHLIG